MSSERRDHPRIQCRLACAVRLDRARIPGRVLDISEGGLCILLPDRVEKSQKLVVTIDVPGRGLIDLETTVWHQRRFTQPASGRRGWATGLVIDKAGDGYASLVGPEGGDASPAADLATESGLNPGAAEVSSDDEHPIFRLHVKAVGTTRSRVLTLSAYSADFAREAVLNDLPGEWEILKVEPV